MDVFLIILSQHQGHFFFCVERAGIRHNADHMEQCVRIFPIMDAPFISEGVIMDALKKV